ncbi:MAG: DUF2752 domain-containing protein [Actinomycetes bacterium]
MAPSLTATAAPGTRVAPGRRSALGLPVATVLGAAAVVGYIAVVDPNHPGHYPTCPFYWLTGYYCPGCGSLRAIHDLAHGQLAAAAHLNVLTVAFIPVLAVMWLSWSVRRARGLPRRRVAPGWVVWGLLGLVLAFGLVRNLPFGHWLAP